MAPPPTPMATAGAMLTRSTTRRRGTSGHMLNRLVATVAVVVALGLAYPPPLVAGATAADPPPTTTQCWRVHSGNRIAKAASDLDCAVRVTFATFSTTFTTADKVPLFWSVDQRESTTPNALQMPWVGVSISATYVRTCDGGPETCGPPGSGAPPRATSKPQKGNFVAGDTVQFVANGELPFPTPGDQVLAAVVEVQDPLDPSVRYVYATYTTLTIAPALEDPSAGLSHEQGVVRCRMSSQSPVATTPLDPSASVLEGDHCNVDVRLAPLPLARAQRPTTVAWAVRLDLASGDQLVRLPNPLPTAEVKGESYEITNATVKICRNNATCDEFTPDGGFDGLTVLGPARVIDGRAAFTTDAVTLPTPGRHVTMLHLVFAGPGKRRYDVVYYFELVAVEADEDLDARAQAIDQARYVDPSAASSHCWRVLADATDPDATTRSVVADGQGAECPYAMTLALSPSTTLPSATSTLDATWSVRAQSGYAQSKFPAANRTLVYDAATQAIVAVPTLSLYACPNATACTPFFANKTLLYRATARNFSANNSVEVSATGLKFPDEGAFTVFAHVVVPTGPNRLDLGSFAAVTVGDPAHVPGTPKKEKSKSHTTTYVIIGVVVGVAIVAAVVFVVWFRKRRRQKRFEKLAPLGLLGAGRARTAGLPTESRGSLTSEPTAGSFEYVRAERSPMDATHGSSTALQTYDPYTTKNYVDMSVDESNLSFVLTPNQRPSNTSESYDV